MVDVVVGQGRPGRRQVVDEDVGGQPAYAFVPNLDW
jgi:hypothetical protein